METPKEDPQVKDRPQDLADRALRRTQVASVARRGREQEHERAANLHTDAQRECERIADLLDKAGTSAAGAFRNAAGRHKVAVQRHRKAIEYIRHARTAPDGSRWESASIASESVMCTLAVQAAERAVEVVKTASADYPPVWGQSEEDRQLAQRANLAHDKIYQVATDIDHPPLEKAYEYTTRLVAKATGPDVTTAERRRLVEVIETWQDLATTAAIALRPLRTTYEEG